VPQYVSHKMGEEKIGKIKLQPNVLHLRRCGI
jgi:hypothetical protein